MNSWLRRRPSPSRPPAAPAAQMAWPGLRPSILQLIGCLLGLSTAAAAQAAGWTLSVQNASGQPLGDVAMAVEVKGQTGRAGAGSVAQMEQRQRQFQPFVLVVQTGTAVNFPNFDTVRHHVYSFSAAKKFDLKLYTGTPTDPVLFDKPGVATLGCNIHDEMSAHIVIVDTPFFGKSNAQGQLRLELPPGEHVLKVWHPRLGSPLLSSFPLRLVPGQEPAPLQLPLR